MRLSDRGFHFQQDLLLKIMGRLVRQSRAYLFLFNLVMFGSMVLAEFCESLCVYCYIHALTKHYALTQIYSGG